MASLMEIRRVILDANYQLPTTDNTVFTAEITDTWDEIIANIDNGKYATRYEIGSYKPLDLGTEGIINMQVVAKDADELASGGTAPLTFLSMELLTTRKKMNSTETSANGWAVSEMRSYLDNTIKPMISSNIQSRLQNVNKTYFDKTTSSTLTSIDKLWIPSIRELSDGELIYRESSGVTYYSIYVDSEARKKNINGEVTAYWLRTARNRYEHFANVTTSGITSTRSANSMLGIALGFCLG